MSITGQEISSAPTCAAFLSAARKVARDAGDWTDRSCAVLEQMTGYYAVESYEGEIVWEGKAHCRYCARAEAIAAKAGKEVA